MLRIMTVVAVAMATAMGTSYVTGVRCNVTPSMPLGLWRVQAIKGAVQRGEVVTLCLASEAAALGRERDYLTGGECPGDVELLIKTVAAVPGDQVEVSTDGIAVDGIAIARSQALPHDDRGRELHAVASGIYRVGPDQVWVISGFDLRSYDSRYFGPVPIANLRGQARPLFIQGKSNG